MTVPNACPGMEVWRRFHAGDVSDEELETLAAHQENCESCRARLASLDAPPDESQSPTTVIDRPAQAADGGAGAEVSAAAAPHRPPSLPSRTTRLAC
jgi:hypothetical protein